MRGVRGSGDGRAAVAQRTRLIEDILQRLWRDFISPDAGGPHNFALVATGGFGRGWLFPYSDIDLLFLYADRAGEEAHQEAIRQFSQELWDLKLKLSPASRTLAECERFDPNNTEFTISLLDCRYLAGDHELFARLHDKVIPKLVMRESKALLQGLAEVTRERHGKSGDTVFHLEPNLKEAPGGLRDYNVACWLALISAMDKLRDWPDASSLRAPVRKQLDAALEFLMAARCFLHLRHGRDDNSLSWEAQDEAAARKIGAAQAAELTAADWMRIYFGHARAVQRTVTQLLDEIPEAWSSLRRQFQGWRSRPSSPDFSVVDGLIFLQQSSSLQDPRDAAAAVSLHGAAWAEVECDHRAPHRAGAAGAGGDSAARGGTVAVPAGNAVAAACRGSAARDAFAAAADAAVAGVEADRFAGGARFLSSLHRG